VYASVMQLAVPYFAQSNSSACGAASLRMLFAFHGITITEQTIARRAGTTKKHGTSPAGLYRAIRSVGLKAKRSARVLWPDVRSALDAGLPVLVHYREPGSDESHYALAIGYDKRDVVLHDPAHGKAFRLPRKAFEARWIGFLNIPRDRGWMIVAYPPVRAS
jgi:ABC-type bacteriocin/lantibiotic exporter with double-glycine peptidase domain